MAATPARAASASVSSISDNSDDDDDSSQSSDVSVWDSQELCRHAERLELELASISVDPILLSTLNDLLLEVYNVLRPKPRDYEQRNTLVHVFNKMTSKIFGNRNDFPVVEAFGSFTMDLFTPFSDLDLSINFSDSTDDQYTRKKKIFILRKCAKVLYSHQRNGIFCGVLPILNARVPILKVIDRGTGIDCDISVENKDVQTRNPPILPPFSTILNDGLDCAHVEKNIRLFKGFGRRNKESVAQLFLSLINKLLSAESLWEHGLCASNWEASWISKTWKKGVGNLSVEDFLDRSQNFARSVGKVQMQKICKGLRDCSLNLLDFMRGKIDTWKLKTLLFGHLSPDELVSKLRLRHAKAKRKAKLCLESRYLFQKRAKRGAHHVEPQSNSSITNVTGLPTPTSTKPIPRILYKRFTNSSNQIVHIPWLLIVPSGFGYGLSVQLPVDPHCGKGILGPPPGNLSSLGHEIQQLQQRPLLPTPNQ